MRPPKKKKNPNLSIAPLQTSEQLLITANWKAKLYYLNQTTKNTREELEKRAYKEKPTENPCTVHRAHILQNLAKLNQSLQ